MLNNHSLSQMLSLGCDTGGTFTDLVLAGPEGLEVLKLPTTRPDPAEGVLQGVTRLAAGREFELAHGTTVGTNALLERQGARVALVTSEGFGDLLILGRGQRPRLYDLFPRRPELMVPRELCFEVGERLDAEGKVVTPLDPAEVEKLAQDLLRLEVEAVAVCLLFSYRSAAHEETIESILKEAGLEVYLSSRVSPEYREYERATTTVLAAFLGKPLGHYLQHLQNRLQKKLWVVHSAGAVMRVDEAHQTPNHLVLSGPAAGVRGAFTVAEQAGFTRLITLDMGGTSTDVALVDGQIASVPEANIEGLPVRQPMLDIETVGAGGGSIAWVDAGGGLRVGPRSAGSDPGPAAYGKGDQATVTDAQLVLGWLPSTLAGGRTLDVEASWRAVGCLAQQLKLELTETAWGIVEVAATTMERALRRISMERGYDPRDFILLPFGGQGPLMAAEMARRLTIKKILVPPFPGVLSAFGAAVAPWLREFSLTVLSDPDDPENQEVFQSLEQQARREMSPEATLTRWADLRYRGQGSELTLPWSEQVGQDFHQEHQRRFSYRREQSPVQVVTLRVRASVARPYGGGRALLPETKPSPPRQAIFDGQSHRCPVLTRAQLSAPSDGPLIIEQYDTTLLVPPGWSVAPDAHGNLLLEDQNA